MEQIGRARAKAKPEREPREPLEEVRARDLVAEGNEPPPQEFLFGNELMPIAQVVALSGPTTVGKSLVALQAAFSVVTGQPWFGLQPSRTGNVVYYSAEDEIDELNRRLRSIQLGHADALAKSEFDLIIIDRSCDEALLMVFDTKLQTMRPTTVFERLSMTCEKHNPVLTIVETQNDTFSGNANDPGQARQYITAWRKLAIRLNGVVLPLSHPSRRGEAEGDGDSGSVAWMASARQHLYMTRGKKVKDKDSGEYIEEDPDLRRIEVMSSNRSRVREPRDQGPLDGRSFRPRRTPRRQKADEGSEAASIQNGVPRLPPEIDEAAEEDNAQ